MSARSPEMLQKHITDYLKMCLEDGSTYVKSRHIADELDVSVKRVGAAMASLEANTDQFAITRWGGSSDGITWCVEATTPPLGTTSPSD